MMDATSMEVGNCCASSPGLPPIDRLTLPIVQDTGAESDDEGPVFMNPEDVTEEFQFGDDDGALSPLADVGARVEIGAPLRVEACVRANTAQLRMHRAGLLSELNCC
jgi:hypothetical protein